MKLKQPRKPPAALPTSQALPMAVPSEACPAQSCLVPKRSQPCGGRRATEITSSTLIIYVRHTYFQHDDEGRGDARLQTLVCCPLSKLCRWHWCPHADGFAPGCFCCVWSQDPVPTSCATTATGFLCHLSPLTQANPQVPDSQVSVRPLGWPLQKPQFQGRDVGC